MNRKLKYLISVSLKRKINTKWFVVVNVLLCILIVGLINIDSVIKAFGGDFDERQDVFVIDNTNFAFDVLKSQNESYNSLVKLSDDESFIFKKSHNDYKKILKKNPDCWVLILNKDDHNILKASIISNDYINANNYAKIITIINNSKMVIAMGELNISKTDFAKISDPVTIDRKIVSDEKNDGDENAQMIISTIFPIFILPFFALTIFLVQMIGAEVNEEKTTRGMEIIISNVSPKVHLMSKVISGNLFVLLQGFLLVLFAGIGFLVRSLLGTGSITEMSGVDISKTIGQILSSDIGGQLIYIIPLTLLLMILTFFAYSLLAGILASMTTNIEDFQQLQTPIMIISLVGYYLAVMAGVFEGSLFIKVLAFVPFISAILAPCLLVLGQFSVVEFCIAVMLVIVVIYILVKFGFKIYKQGILNYSSKNLWKKMFKALKGK